ncbi:MAG: hypothetical protein HYY86_03125 [Candidatus Harrisonbacteria bacterium]|nr:hypothetical protein [Candidatus Harrisonbacteria bacterium]
MEIRLFSGVIGWIIVAAEQFAGAAHQIALGANGALTHMLVDYIGLETLKQVRLLYLLARSIGQERKNEKEQEKKGEQGGFYYGKNRRAHSGIV